MGREKATEPAWVDSEEYENIQKAMKLTSDLRYEVAQLDLLASPTVREVARALFSAHDKEALRLVLLKAAQGDFDGRRAAEVKIQELEKALVARTRTDLGLDSWQVPPNSLLATFLNRNPARRGGR